MSDKPRIVIGVPCYREVAPEILEDWMRFAYHCGRRLTQFEFCLAIKTKTEQFRARNAIVQAAQQANADWLLMIDDDMVIDTMSTTGQNTRYDFVEKIIGHGKDVCGVLYYQRGGNCQPVLMAKVPESKGYRFLRDDEIEDGLQRVDVAGGGCLLVNMRVFDKMKFPFFAPEHEYGTDIQLCRQAEAAGFEVWADTSIELGHLKNERVVVTGRNRMQFAEDTIPGEVKQFVDSDLYMRLFEDAKEWTGRPDADAMRADAFEFMNQRNQCLADGKTDAEWYREFPKERVCRQVWFNTEDVNKQQMTKFILASVAGSKPLEILDFGCGIGIPAFSFAEKGHKVTAMDIRGTGTLEFLKWRKKKHGIPMTIYESEGGVPALHGMEFDVIVAMDCLEHIAEWKWSLEELAKHLKPGGALFTNNGILEDDMHAEHYHIDNKDFIRACMEFDLMPVNQITFVKKAESELSVRPFQEAVNA